MTSIQTNNDSFIDPLLHAERVLSWDEILLQPQRWHEARRQHIGGTDIAALMGEGQYGKNALGVWLQKTGRVPEQEATEVMSWGRALEDAIAQQWSEDIGIGIRREGLLRSRTYPHLSVTVDRLTADGGGLEIKNSSWFMARHLKNGTPRGWWWQMVGSLLATGAPHWHLMCLIGGNQPYMDTISRDDPPVRIALEMLGELVEQWWASYIDKDTPPPDSNDDDDEEPAERGDIVESDIPELAIGQWRRWREIKTEMKRLADEEEQIKDLFSSQLRVGQEYHADGIPLVKMQSRRGNLKFQEARFRRDHPDLDINDYFERGKTSYFPKLIGGSA